MNYTSAGRAFFMRFTTLLNINVAGRFFSEDWFINDESWSYNRSVTIISVWELGDNWKEQNMSTAQLILRKTHWIISYRSHLIQTLQACCSGDIALSLITYWNASDLCIIDSDESLPKCRKKTSFRAVHLQDWICKQTAIGQFPTLFTKPYRSLVSK